MTAYVLVVASAVLAVVSWAFARGDTLRTLTGALVAVLGGVAAIATLFEEPLTGDQRPVMIMFGAILAVAGG
ncbi:MAG: hypothetical protein L0K86_25660, partial [Actinomycetia bacterium]|nr:hypothetical protein [Actinomycetes bacterium]